MHTIDLDNSQRVFLINRKGYSTRYWFCNLKHIPDVLTKELELHDEYTVSEYWNFKFKRMGKARLNEMFAANQIEFKIK